MLVWKKKKKGHLVYYKEKVMLVPCRKVRNFCFLQLSYPFRKFWVFVGSFLNIIMWEYFATENSNQCSCCLYEAVWRPKSGWSTREGTLPDTWGFVKHFSRSLPGGLKWICLRGSWAQFALDLTSLGNDMNGESPSPVCCFYSQHHRDPMPQSLPAASTVLGFLLL